MEILWILIPGGLLVLVGIVSWVYELSTENFNLKELNDELAVEIDQWRAYKSNLDAREEDIDWKVDTFTRLLSERSRNFPLVGEVWSELTYEIDSLNEQKLLTKSRPAPKAADAIKLIKQEKKALIQEMMLWQYRARNYEAIYPWLAEELAADIEDDFAADINFSVYSEDERSDPVTNYISPDSYRTLTVTDRNQLALDRYWQRGKKTNWMIGKMYERYIGYLYETEGWKVTYYGIQKRYEDLGRDLIAEKGQQLHVIQCKNWSKFKTIYENHIFQLFGTAYSMKKDYPGKIITPVFYTSTNLSDIANEFSRLLKIKVKANVKFEVYPAIKCNISPTGEKIYHLPFDQQYDHTVITLKSGELYASTVAEAEQAGFRRAYRWSGLKAAR